MNKNGNISHANNLFPVFLKLETLRLLIIGGGKIALEKLEAVLNNSPGTRVRIVSPEINKEIREIAKQYKNIELVEKVYDRSDLEKADLLIVAVNDFAVSEQISSDAKKSGKLVNVADKPELCDFYLGSIVQKGNLKIAISTNGKSPTVAKRLKEVLNSVLPDEFDELLINLHTIRNNLKGNFESKVKKLNELTRELVENGFH